MKIKIWLLPALVLLLYCGRVPDTHYYTIYYPLPERLNAPPRFAGSLVVAKITAEEAYQGDRLVYQRNPFEYDYYNYRRWIEPPPDLIEKWLVRHLRAQNYFTRVSSYANYLPLTKDYELRLHIADFKEVDTNGRWQAEVRFEYIFRTSDQIRSEGVLAKTVVAQERTPLAIVQALSQAVQQSFDALTEKIGADLTEN